MAIATILVEDSETIRETLIPTMEEIANAKVIAFAATAREGVDALEKYADSWQLIVIDLFLRAGIGFEVLRACQNRRPDQYAVILSNYATDDIRKHAKAIGADAVFDKSTEIQEFLDYCLSLVRLA